MREEPTAPHMETEVRMDFKTAVLSQDETKVRGARNTSEVLKIMSFKHPHVGNVE